MLPTACIAASLAWFAPTANNLIVLRSRKSDNHRCGPVVAAIGSVPRSDLSKKYDLLVVGGGPAGVAGALKGAFMGKRVLLVDKPKAAPDDGGLDFYFGGPTGLFSKALRDCAKDYDIGSLFSMGLDRDVIFKQLQNSCLRLARNNAQSSTAMLKKFKVDYLQGEAQLDLNLFNGRVKDEVKFLVRLHAQPEEQIQIRSTNALLCTGSCAFQPPDIPFDGHKFFDSDSINSLDYLPKSIVVSGSGIIAIEMANIFRKLGSDVTMVVRGTASSALDRIGIDDTIAERLIRGLRDQKVNVLEETTIDSYMCIAGPDSGDERLIGGEDCELIRFGLKKKIAGELVDAGEIEAELFLACVGRRPRARGTTLALEANGVKLTERGFIEVDESFRTSQPGVYAAGDCIEGPALASTGVDQAQKAVSAMFGMSGLGAEKTPFPVGVWTIPEVGYYGLTLRQAQQQGYDADVGIATYDLSLRGRVFAPDGMLKLVFDRQTAIILGVHIIGTDACEMVHYGMDLVAQRATIFDVIGTIFAAVTFHELFKEAALNANEKLSFGIEWQDILAQLQVGMPMDKSIDEALLEKRFNEIDVNGNGSLDETELLEVFRGLGSKVSPQVIANLIRLADEDGNGTIEWPEFRKIYQMLQKMNNLCESEQQQNTAEAQPASA